MIQNHKKILAPIDFSEYSMEALRGAEELARIKKDDYGNSAKVFTQVMVGPPVPKLVEYAKQQQIDLILLATHGRTVIEHLMIGSVAEKLARYAPCSVLVFRQRKP